MFRNNIGEEIAVRGTNRDTIHSHILYHISGIRQHDISLV